MNREIEFRGKRKDNGEWVYGYYTKTDLGTFIIKLGVNYKVTPETVGQYVRI